MTAAELLAKVETAIDGILERGQSYTINGRTYTRANLAELRRFRKELEVEVEKAAQGGGIRVRYGVPRW